jgi:hypothetical protein
MGELVRRTNDEGVEGVAEVQPGGRRGGDRSRGLRFLVWGRRRQFRRWRRQGSTLGHEHQRRVGTTNLGQCLGEHDRVMLGEPVLEEGVRHPHRYGVPAVGHKSRWLEPGVEAVPVNFGFDPGEDLVPDTGVHYNFTRERERSIERNRPENVRLPTRAEPDPAFPQSFPQLWKSWGRNRTGCQAGRFAPVRFGLATVARLPGRSSR